MSNKPFAIGGTLSDGTPGQPANVLGHSYVYRMAPGTSSYFNFVEGVTVSHFPIEFSMLEYLAVALAESRFAFQGLDVHVKCSGGRYSMDDLYELQDLGGRSGHSVLVVFNTNSRVTLGASAAGRQFHASVLAPFSEVVLENQVGYVDGYIIAKSFSSATDLGTGGVRLYGHCFANGATDAIDCRTDGRPACPNSNTVISGQSGGSAACRDSIRTSKCQRKQSRGKCSKRRIRNIKCPLTCGTCSA